MGNNKRIVILTSDDYHHSYLIQTLSARFAETVAIVESDNAKRRRLLRAKKYKTLVYTYYHICRRKLFGLNAYRKNYFKSDKKSQPSSIHKVSDINSEYVSDVIRKSKPDFVVVCCTSIIKEPLLGQIIGKAINIHGGCLPDYRGNHCFFFALRNGDNSRIGSTIHFIDSGIDTGDVIENLYPEILDSDTPESLYCRAEMMAIHRLADLLDHFSTSNEVPRLPQLYKCKLNKTVDRGPLDDIGFFLKNYRRSTISKYH